MSTSVSVVEVLSPNGRRQKIKVKPSMTIFQVCRTNANSLLFFIKWGAIVRFEVIQNKF